MKHKNRQLLTGILTAALALSLTACSNSPDSNASSQTLNDKGQVVLKVAASPSPHAQILQSVREDLLQQNIDLQIQEFTDYILPNNALDSGDVDANFFQHKPYLDDFNAKNGTNLVSVGVVHFEPLGIFSGKTASLDQLADGAEIAVPNDTTNEARALILLEKNGLITLKDGAGLQATVRDIQDNPKNLKFTELESAQLPRALPDVDLAVINGNSALEGGVYDKLIASEEVTDEAATTYANILAVRAPDENRPEIQALIKALNTEKTREYINSTYQDIFVPVF